MRPETLPAVLVSYKQYMAAIHLVHSAWVNRRGGIPLRRKVSPQEL
jgi:hypothetical protein